MDFSKGKTYHEAMQRGTPDFPAELYRIDSSHPRYQMQTHWHSEFELVRILAGRLRLFLNESEHLLTAGSSVIIPGGTVHGAEAEDCIYECIVFSPSLLYVSGSCRSIIKTAVTESVFYTNNSVIDRIFDSLCQKSPAYEFIFLSCIYNLIGEISAKSPLKSRHSLKNDKYEKIKTALAIIEENYSSPFTLTELSESLGMSPNYFCRFFKEMTQKTPFDYINIYRINVACELLSDGDTSITDIAYSCGFNDLSYFIKLFKKHKGMSPKAYRNSLNKS